MDLPTDRISIALLVVVAALGLVGYLAAFGVSFEPGGMPPALVPVVAVVVAAIVIGVVWVGLGRLD